VSVEEYTDAITGIAQAFDLFPTAKEIEPALIELGLEVDKAWRAVFPFAVLYCDDRRLAMILGKHRGSLLKRVWKWLTK